MKKTALLILIIGLLSFQLIGNLEKIKQTDINFNDLNFSKSIAQKIMNGQCTKKYYKLNNKVAENSMIKRLTEDVQKFSYQQVSDIFGQYDSLKFQEVWRQVNGDMLTIFRFKGYFNKTKTNPEIRVVLSKNG